MFTEKEVLQILKETVTGCGTSPLCDICNKGDAKECAKQHLDYYKKLFDKEEEWAKRKTI